jgi:transcriptional regulator with XRE-family HTH domain
MKNNIKKYRKERRLTLDEISPKVGLGKSSLSKIENDQQNLYADTACLLADIFNISVDDLLGREWNDPEKTIIKTREFDYNDMLKKLESLSDKQLYNLSGAIDYILEMRDDKETFTKKDTSSNSTLKY